MYDDNYDLSHPIYNNLRFYTRKNLNSVVDKNELRDVIQDATAPSNPANLNTFKHGIFDLQQGSYTQDDLLAEVGNGATKIAQLQLTVIEGVTDITIGEKMENLQVGATYQFMYKPGFHLPQITIDVNSGFAAVEVLAL